MITIENATIYSMNGEMAYQADFSDGTSIRVIESRNRYIRNEYLKNGEWVQAGKPYVRAHDTKRNAERLQQRIIRICNA